MALQLSRVVFSWALQVTWVGSAPKSNPLPFYIPLLTENVPPGTPDILASHTGVPFLPTKRGEKTPAWKATASQSHRRSKIIKIISFTWFRNAQPCPQGVFVFWYACSRKAPGNEGWGILCNHSYSAMNFLPEGLPGLQAT